LAVILLIIVAVALALSVALFGQRLTDEADDQSIPDIGFVTESPTVRVVHAQDGLDWFEHFRFGGSCDPTLNGQPFPTATGRPVMAGDRLGCDLGERLSIMSAPSFGNALLYEVEFS
jgi:hypothetical protein